MVFMFSMNGLVLKLVFALDTNYMAISYFRGYIYLFFNTLTASFLSKVLYLEPIKILKSDT